MEDSHMGVFSHIGEGKGRVLVGCGEETGRV
jgi:hypothetical protein